MIFKTTLLVFFEDVWSSSALLGWVSWTVSLLTDVWLVVSEVSVFEFSEVSVFEFSEVSSSVAAIDSVLDCVSLSVFSVSSVSSVKFSICKGN